MTPGLDPATVFVQGAPTDARSWVALATEVERLGLGGLYVADHPGTSPSPFVALAAAAAVTGRITLGTCVVNAGLWDPVALASEVATLDVLSSGRALLGLGAGHTPAEWTMRGLEPPPGPQRIARLEEVVGATLALLAGESVTVDGQVTLRDARLEAPRPVAPRVPLMIGGNGPRLLDIAARYADVVGITGLGRTLPDGHHHTVDWSRDRVRATVERVRATAQRAGRRPMIEALVQRVEITDDASRAAAAMADAVEGATPADILTAPYVWMGTIDEVREEILHHTKVTGVDRWVVRENALPAVRTILDRR